MLAALVIVRTLVATLVVAGCSFDHGVVQEQADPTGGGGTVMDPTVDSGAPPVPLVCKFPDPALRLCIEFDDKRYTPTSFDASQYGLNALASDVGEWTRNNTPAAATFWNTSMRVPETPMLDISGEITFETWMRVPLYHPATLLGNDQQYAITLDPNGRVTCRVGNSAATSDPIGNDTWRHIACTYAREKLSVYVDGVATKCQSAAETIPTRGTQGTRLAAGFTGAIDDARIYARRLTAAEICSHADKTTCTNACDDD